MQIFDPNRVHKWSDDQPPLWMTRRAFQELTDLLIPTRQSDHDREYYRTLDDTEPFVSMGGGLSRVYEEAGIEFDPLVFLWYCQTGHQKFRNPSFLETARNTISKIYENIIRS